MNGSHDTWASRERGERPVVKQQELYLGFVKESGISTNQFHNKDFPFVLPGLGSSGEHCMCKTVWGVGVNGDKLGYINLKCKRIECPNCYLNWLHERVFDCAVKIEAYAKVVGERPAHVTSEVIGVSSEAGSWSPVDYDNFHKRSYRHISAIGGIAGLRAFHPYKIHKHIKVELKNLGYGVPGNGYWKGVRSNVLNYPYPEAYYYYLAPHDHNIIFPSFLREHFDNAFFVKKIGVLDGVFDTVRVLMYQLSHCGIYKGTETLDNHPVVFFGALHKFVPEKFLTEYELLCLKQEVAEAMNMRYFNGELQPMKEEMSNKKDFHPISDFVMYGKNQEAWVNAIVSSFPMQYQGFWLNLILDYNHKISDTALKKDCRYIFLEDIQVPEGIEVVEVT